MAIHHHRYSGHPPSALPWPYKRHPNEPRSTPHLTEPFSSPLPRWNPSPPSSRDLFVPPPSPGRHTTARAPVSAPPCLLSAPASVHGGPSAPGRSTETWTRSMNYPLGNNSLFRIFWNSCKEVPGLLGNQPAVQILPILHSGPRVFSEINLRSGIFAVWPKIGKIFTKRSLASEKSTKNSSKTSKIHIFPTTTPNPVILVPKFFESLPLSFYAFI
jgi:hypothetical protein